MKWIIDFKSVEIEAKDEIEANLKAEKWLENNQPEINLVWKQ